VIPAYVESFLALLALVGAMFLGLFPTQYPILRRVGISSVGLRLVFPLRAITVKWPTIQWIGPDYMDAQLGRTRLHVRLTPGQVQQISNFLGRPLA